MGKVMPVSTLAARNLVVMFATCFFLAGCWDHNNGAIPPPPGGFDATVGASNEQYAPTLGVLVFPWTVTGPAGTPVDIVPTYSLGAGADSGGSAFLPATAAPTGGGFSVLPPATPLSFVIPSSGTISGSYNWFAGADLGFIGTICQFHLTPINTATSQQGGTGSSPNINYTSGLPSSGATGGVNQAPPPSGVGTGRVNHTTEALAASNGSHQFLVTGGSGGSGGAYTNAERYAFNPSTYALTLGSANGIGGARTLHASSFFMDASTGATRVLITGGVTGENNVGSNAASYTLANRLNGMAMAASTGIVYTPSPESANGTSAMSEARCAHTATWVPGNKVLIIGGATITQTVPSLILQAAQSIEEFEPATSTFSTPTSNTIARALHTTVLLANGQLLIVGGVDPATGAGTNAPLLYNPNTQTITSLSAANGAAAANDRFGHTATRLVNGWVLIAGGRSTETSTIGELLNSAFIYKPELGTFESVGTLAAGGTPSMPGPRALHAATLLGNMTVMLSGGLWTNGTAESFTKDTSLFLMPTLFSPSAGTGFTETAASSHLNTARGLHSATSVPGGNVFVVGGRNQTSAGQPYLDDAEVFAFSNQVPVIASVNTSSNPVAGNININFNVSDVDGDGGYVIVRFRDTSGNIWKQATISSQSPLSPGQTGHTGEVAPGATTMVWNFAADGVVSGTNVEVQILPFGATLGSAASVTFTL
jgi:hypothetical protein